MSAFYQLLQDIPSVDETNQSDEPTQESGGYSEEIESQGLDYDFIPEAWRPTNKFASSDEELDFYRSKYPALWQHVTSDDFANAFVDQYSGLITEHDSELKAAKAIMRGLDTDPINFLMTYIPEYAGELGLGNYYSDEAIDQIVQDEVTRKFGENWREAYDPSDLIRRNSVSSQILKYTQQVENQLEQQNRQYVQNRNRRVQEFSQMQQQPHGTQTQNIENIMDVAIDSYFNDLAPEGVTEDEFIETFVNAMAYQPTMRDIHKLMNYNNVIDQERKRAYEQGRKAMLDEYRRGSKQAANDYVPRTETFEDNRPKSFMGLRLGNMSGY
jgi:hypothetical protein